MTTQISAYISKELKLNMENYSANYGIKKSFLIENALEHYLYALNEIPQEFIIPKKLVLSENSFQKVMNMMENPPEPTQALIDLMKKND